MERIRKAIVAVDGQSIEVCAYGMTWRAKPSLSRRGAWLVLCENKDVPVPAIVDFDIFRAIDRAVHGIPAAAVRVN